MTNFLVAARQQNIATSDHGIAAYDIHFHPPRKQYIQPAATRINHHTNLIQCTRPPPRRPPYYLVQLASFFACFVDSLI